MAISNHDKGETDQTFSSTFSTSNMNFSLENNSKGANKIREIVPVVPITEKQNENANAWYSKFDTAWYFSTVNDSKPVVKVLEKKVIDSERSKTNKISKPEQNDVGIKNKMDMKTKLNESPKEPKRFKRSKRGRYLFSNDVSDEFQSQDDIIPNKERENNTQTIIRKGTPITIRTRPPNIPSDSNSENIFHIPIYYESHHLNPKKFWSWKKPNNVNFDDLFIDQKDYEISVRAKFTQCTLLFILFIQFIILLRNEIYSLAIVVLIVIWLILFYFVVRSCFEVKNSLIS